MQNSYLYERGGGSGCPQGASAGFRDKVFALKLEDEHVWCNILYAFLWVLNSS